jgi:hypothetical protein
MKIYRLVSRRFEPVTQTPNRRFTPEERNILSRVLVTTDGVLDWMIRFTDILYTELGTTGNYSAIADLHTLELTVTYALGFSVFTSRILATDFSQFHCKFKSHMKSSSHRLIPFLPFLLNHLRLPYLELDPILHN